MLRGSLTLLVVVIPDDSGYQKAMAAKIFYGVASRDFLYSMKSKIGGCLE